MKVDFGDGSFIDTERPTLRIQAFKGSGKWYSSQSTIISEDLLWILQRPWALADLMKKNDSTIKDLSPLSTGFSEMYFVVDAFLPGTMSGFCTMLVDNTK